MSDIIERLTRDLPPDMKEAVCPTSLLREAAGEIERLRNQIKDACKVFDRYELHEHAFHYRRAALGLSARSALAPEGK
jgi:hypothetical protein